MDMNKYSTPNLPTMKHLFEDLSNPYVVKLDEPIKLSSDDEMLQNAYVCYQNLKQMKGDSQKMSELNVKLEELNRKLIENIGSMKAHT